MKTVKTQLTNKIKLEQLFKPEVATVFNSIAKDFKIVVARTGLPPRIDGYNAVWQVVLEKHYRRVQKAFVGSVKAVISDEIQSVFLSWRNKFKPLEADFINETTHRQMNEAIQEAIEAAKEELRQASNRELSANATRILKRKLRNRIDMIINNETQKAAEAAKFMEAEIISGQEPTLLGGTPNADTKTTKQWLTVGDKHVRPIHKDANGQIKGLNEPYEVGGELLMHPGDTSLGASLSNVANCRCISMYRFI